MNGRSASENMTANDEDQIRIAREAAEMIVTKLKAIDSQLNQINERIVWLERKHGLDYNQEQEQKMQSAGDSLQTAINRA